MSDRVLVQILVVLALVGLFALVSVIYSDATSEAPTTTSRVR